MRSHGRGTHADHAKADELDRVVGVPIGDRVAGITGVDVDEPIGPAAIGEHVGPEAAGQCVVIVVTRDRFIARSAVQRVVVVVARQRVGARATIDPAAPVDPATMSVPI